MKAVTQSRAIFFGLSIVLLVGCAETAGTGQRGFAGQYNAARTALEKGNYATAGRLYERLLSKPGPLDARIRVEYAHTMLRSGEFEKASQIAGEVATKNDGATRAAALSVQGTADHEVALKLLRNGDQSNGAARLRLAQKALDEVLKSHPDFDPLGSLAGRRASIAALLKKLG